MKNIGIIGLKIDNLHGDPQITLPGNPVRSWAIFSLLENYGFRTELYVGPSASVDDSLKTHFDDRLVYDQGEFIERTKGRYDALIVCGTKIQETLSHHPWLISIVNIPLFFALCAHNDAFQIPQPLLDKLVGATFVSPRHAYSWQRKHPECRTGIMTHGQTPKESSECVPGSDVILVGHIHAISYLIKYIEISQLVPERKFHLEHFRLGVTRLGIPFSREA